MKINEQCRLLFVLSFDPFLIHFFRIHASIQHSCLPSLQLSHAVQSLATNSREHDRFEKKKKVRLSQSGTRQV